MHSPLYNASAKRISASHKSGTKPAKYLRFLRRKFSIMQKLFYALILVFTLQVSSAQTAVNMSLDEAINYAIKNQPSFQNYLVEQQISAAKKLQSVSGFLPKITGSFALQQNLNLPIVALKFPNPITGAEENLKIQQGLKYQGTGSVDFSVPLVDANAIGDLKFTQKQQKLTDLQLQQAMIDLKEMFQGLIIWYC